MSNIHLDPQMRNILILLIKRKFQAFKSINFKMNKTIMIINLQILTNKNKVSTL